MIDMRWTWVIVTMLYGMNVPLLASAEPSLPIPRTSSTTEQHLQDEALYLKEETVSIASRYEQPISEAPSNVYVVTDEDIRRSGATDLPTVLRRIPGLEVMQLGSTDFNVSMRGNNQLIANKLLVLVDGRSVYIDAATLVLWTLLPVTLPEISRIEILKGPASAIYGFNAFDGVINIITKSPEEMKGTTLQVTGGDLGTVISSAVQAGSVSTFSYRLSVGQERVQEWKNRDALALNLWKLNSHTEYLLPNQSQIAFDVGLARADPYDGPGNGVSSGNLQHTQPYVYLTYKAGHFALRGWWNGVFTDNQNLVNPILAPVLKIISPAGRTDTSNHFNSYNIEADYSTRVLPTVLLSAGVNYRRNLALATYLSEHTKEHRLGFYFNGEWEVMKSLTAVAGLRYDLDTFIDPTYSPRAALTYSPREGHTFRLSGGLAFRPPQANERNLLSLSQISFPGGTVTTPAIGSRDLVPEQIVSYDLGYNGWFFQHRLRLRANIFFNQLSHLISNRATGPGPTAARQPSNGGSADIYGGEVGVEYLWSAWLSGFANMSYQQFSQDNTGFNRRGMPRFKWNVGLRGNWESGMQAELLYHYVGAAIYPLSDAFPNLKPLLPAGTIIPSEQVDSYHLLNLRIGYRFWQQVAADGSRREAEVAVSVFNALNDTHREHPLGDLIGTRVMGWLTVKL